MAMGLADDLLSATLLASRAPVVLCPAMHTEMWEQPSVQENLATLRRRGVMVLEPVVGRLAGGDEGAGRLVEPEVIVDFVERVVAGYRGVLSGSHVIVTAGGTREAIDPVRVVTNRSSGHQGYALAEVAFRLGARVTLISAASRELALDVARGVEVVAVESAAQMYDEVIARVGDADALIMAAAVSDYTLEASAQKLKKSSDAMTLSLTPTRDILSEVLARRRAGQVVVGFAAESHDVMANAHAKLARKDVDLLVVNDVSAPGAGFEHATNEVVLLTRDGAQVEVSRRSKEAVSYEILARVASLLAQGAT
jgi:phosphopantothenoylcysteine decarboxylase/phosphopantothenate--cysteine ligase